MILWHPDAERYPVPDRPGKPWVGGSGNPKLVLHTWEFTGRWPNYGPAPHLTLWPRPFSPTPQLRQHIPFDRAAYSMRNNAAEDDRNTWQIEIAGRARDTHNYPDEWYEDVANAIRFFTTDLAVPAVFADFTTMRSGWDAPQRLTYRQWDQFAGILGHGHAPAERPDGTLPPDVADREAHWDPGRIDAPRLQRFLEEDTMPAISDVTWKLWFEKLRSLEGDWRYYATGDGTVEFDPPWGEGPIDGQATAAERTYAFNLAMQDLATQRNVQIETEKVDVVRTVRIF